MALFANREDAGKKLAKALKGFEKENPVILALPRGGVPVGYEVAKALDASLDVLLVRKIGTPGAEELAAGAIIDGVKPELVLNEDVVQNMGVPESYLEEESARQLEEIERRRKLYRPDRAPLEVKDRTVIVVDDGIATGATMLVALKALRRKSPKHLVVAVPVAPPTTVDKMRAVADEVICLAMPEPFFGVGGFYADFTQTTDDDVVKLLQA